MIQKAFTIGNSTAITLPASSNIKPGTKLRVKKVTKNEIIYEILENSEIKLVNDYIQSISNGFLLPSKMSQKELITKLKSLEENPYERN